MFWYYGIPYHVYLQIQPIPHGNDRIINDRMLPALVDYTDFFFTSVSPQFIQKHSLKFHFQQYNEWESSDSVEQKTGEMGYM